MRTVDFFFNPKLEKIKSKENFVFFVLFLLSLTLSFLIFLIISDYIKNTQNFFNVSFLLLIDLFIILLLIFFTFLKVKKLWILRKEKKSGSYLHIQLSTLLVLLTLIPSISVTIFSLIFFDKGIKTWFTKKVHTAISGSKYISESYFQEHSSNLKNDLIFLQKEINNEKIAFFTDRQRLTNLLDSFVSIKLIDEAIIFERSGQLLAKVGNSFIANKEPAPPLWSIFRADDGEVSVFTNDKNDKVRGLIKLNRVIPTYLYASKKVDSLVISRVNSVNTATTQYLDLEKNINKFQTQFYQLFIAINLLVILLAIWFGLLFANKIVNPIKTIISASEEISAGNLKTRIQKFSKFNDFNILSNTLNNMVDKLLEQKNKLFKAKELINVRRKFTETVIDGVSTGIIYLDKKFNVVLFNKRSMEIIEKKIENKNILVFFPELKEILIDCSKNTNITNQKQIKILKNDSQKIINLKISLEYQKDKIKGYIVTFDDVTELVSAQKKAAWSNVASYLAHEIRNPLTPIKISAQRLQMNHKKKISNEDIFDNCTETIIRQVNDIEKLVAEFSDFARMPATKFINLDLLKLINHQIFNLKIINKNILFSFMTKYKTVNLICDKSQINRVLNNLFKNAIEALTEQKKKKILVQVNKTNNKKYFEILIEDNGEGFPIDKQKLFEPYITNKDNGSGLGLAICKKIIEEHNGDISLFKSRFSGGGVRILFPVKKRISA